MAEKSQKKSGRPKVYDGTGTPTLKLRFDPELFGHVQSKPEGPRAYLERLVRDDNVSGRSSLAGFAAIPGALATSAVRLRLRTPTGHSVMSGCAFRHKDKAFLATVRHGLREWDERLPPEVLVDNEAWKPMKVHKLLAPYAAEIDLEVFLITDGVESFALPSFDTIRFGLDRISLGSPARTIGFPALEGHEFHSPLAGMGRPLGFVRTGFIGAIGRRSETSGQLFYLDCSNCRGQSGAPVFSKPADSDQHNFLGLIVGYLIEDIDHGVKEPQNRGATSVGISYGISAGHILDTINRV